MPAALFGKFCEDSSSLKHGIMFVIFHFLYLLAPAICILTPLGIMLFAQSLLLKVFTIMLVMLYASTFDGSHKRGGRPWPWFINSSIVKYVLEWLPVRILRTTELDSSKQYVFGCHPHGTLAFNRAAVGFSTDTLWDAAFPGVKFRVLTASAAFFVPIIRELWLWSYCIDASKPTAVRIMEKERSSIFVYPGGEREQLETVYRRQRLVLRDRKGFVKLAMQQGASLVPVYAFGETSLYKHSQAGITWRKWLSHKFGVAIPLLYGEYGLLPYRVPVTLVFGEPIATVKTPEPTDEQLNAMHQQYMNALTALFNTHKGDLGYGADELELL